MRGWADGAMGRGEWVGRTETLADVLQPRSVASMATTIGAEDVQSLDPFQAVWNRIVIGPGAA